MDSRERAASARGEVAFIVHVAMPRGEMRRTECSAATPADACAKAMSEMSAPRGSTATARPRDFKFTPRNHLLPLLPIAALGLSA